MTTPPWFVENGLIYLLVGKPNFLLPKTTIIILLTCMRTIALIYSLSFRQSSLHSIRELITYTATDDKSTDRLSQNFCLTFFPSKQLYKCCLYHVMLWCIHIPEIIAPCHNWLNILCVLFLGTFIFLLTHSLSTFNRKSFYLPLWSFPAELSITLCSMH